MRLLDGRLRVSASDLANFLACRHLTRLDVAASSGLIRPPVLTDLGVQALADRGDRHELAVLESLRDRGWRVEDLRSGTRDPQRDAEATRAALEEGLDVLYQSTLLVGDRLGLPDFLVRVDLLGERRAERPRYEVIDAKLARSAKARAVLQATFYSALLAEMQASVPTRMHLALGNQEFLSFRVADYAPYVRQVSQLFDAFVLDSEPAYPPPDTYPDPVEHCAVCRWRTACTKRRREDDDLSLIAGITARQRKALKTSGVSTRRGFAALGSVPRLDRVGIKSMNKIHSEAKLQVQGEDTGQMLWEFIEPERTPEGDLLPNRGLTALPAPCRGDLFFDIEGARFYSEDGKEYGLQYLFGVVDTGDPDEDGVFRYHAFWSFDRTSERLAFERAIDFISDRCERQPDIHVYHYNHYEPTTLDHLSELHETREEVLGRLMGRFGTRAEKLDALLRRRIFVDLYRVMRQGVRASVESYSLKRLEPLYSFRRAVKLDEANETLLRFELSLDEGSAESDLDAQRLVAGYNEDDCRSTLGLRDWLEDRRSELSQELGHEIWRPVIPLEEEQELAPETRELREALLSGVVGDGQIPEEEARILTADLVDWHRRDAKPGWWRFFRLHDFSDEELVAEADAISGLELVGNVGEVRRSLVVRYRFPAQEHPFRAEDQAVDPASGKQWSIHGLDDGAGFLDLRRGKNNTSPHPTALIRPGPIDTSNHRARLRDLAASVVEITDQTWPRSSAFDLLLRRPPRAGQEGALRQPDEDAVDAACRIGLALIECHLPIQGPPGSGKTYTGARLAIELIRAGRRVGVTANSHAVIRNLLSEVAEHNDLGRPILIGQKADEAGLFVSPYATAFNRAGDLRGALQTGEVELVGGTTWLWTREDLRRSVDALIVDEAGQMALANVLAVSHAAPNLILLGDPQQLGQPSAAAHPPGSGVSGLERVLGDQATMPEDRGLFIEQTRRMHPDVCAFTSELFYEGRLTALPELGRQAVLGPGRFEGTGLRIVDVPHQGNDNSSPEEADVVAELLRELSLQSWRDANGITTPIGLEGVLVVAPFNAQIHEIDDALRVRRIDGARVGTVDKFQGQQAPVVIYSMASSTAEDAPRGMEFLYDLRRLNVATSRARCLVILVASPELVRVFCRTPRQMQLASALCRFREMAEG